MSNLALWESVEKTDPSQTKAITGKPYKGTSPKPYFLIHEATRVFGPCGIGWGFQILHEHVVDGAPGDKVHIAHVKLWYEYEGKKGVVEHVGQTMFCGKNKNGPFTDEDAPKKSVTDALVKALSMIGFAGDIFMGRYDDSKYVNDLRHEMSEAAPEKEIAQELVKAGASLAAETYMKMALPIIERTKSATDLKLWWDAEYKTRADILDDLQRARLKQAVTDKVNQLKTKESVA